MLDSSAIRITLPQELYQQVRQSATQSKRSIEDEIIAVVEYAFAKDENWEQISSDIDSALQQLAYLDDQELWQAARQVAPVELSNQMQELVFKQQAQGLSDSEQQEARQLQHYAHKLMLVRAEAALLLKKRDHDITSLSPSPVQ